jgi:CheY-like chemotaxis protein
MNTEMNAILVVDDENAVRAVVESILVRAGYVVLCAKDGVEGCVKKMRMRHAVRKMKADPSESPCRGRLQTAIGCFGQKPRW